MISVKVSNAWSALHASSSEIVIGSTIVPALPVVWGVLSHKSKSGGDVAPHPFEVRLHRFEPFASQVVDVPSARSLLRDETRVAQQSQVARYRRAADRKRSREFMHGEVASAEKSQDLPTVHVRESVERVSDGFRHPTQRAS